LRKQTEVEKVETYHHLKLLELVVVVDLVAQKILEVVD
jgi:hypothetical protein